MSNIKKKSTKIENLLKFALGAVLLFGIHPKALSVGKVSKIISDNQTITLILEHESIYSLDTIFKGNQSRQEGLLTQIGAFDKLVVNGTVGSSIINLNPFSHIEFSSDSQGTAKYISPLDSTGTSKNIRSIYTAKRILKTNLPVETINLVKDWNQGSLQNQLFSGINFRCNSNIPSDCDTTQTVLQLATKYKTHYQYFNRDELSNLELPETLMSGTSKSSIRSALVQYSYQWSRVLASAMNIILFVENEQHKLQLVTFQILLLAPTGVERWLSDSVYKIKISSDIQDQCHSLSHFLINLSSKSSP